MRNAFYSQQQPGGIFTITDNRFTTGNIWFVNSATGVDDTAHGQNPDAPFKTINYPSTQCVAGNGDFIYVMPGHTEVIAAAGGITLGVANVTVVGLGTGRNRPTISFSTANTGTLAITAAQVTLQNLVVDCTGFAAVAAPVKVTGSDCTIQNCDVILANSTNQAVCGVLTTATANRLTVQNCTLRGTNNAGVEAAIIIVGGDGHILQNNFIIGAFTSGVGGIENKTTACTNTLVYNNIIQNLTATNTKAMVFVSTSTGQISDNSMQILSGTAPITAAAMSWVGYNSYAATIGTGTVLV